MGGGLKGAARMQGSGLHLGRQASQLLPDGARVGPALPLPHQECLACRVCVLIISQQGVHAVPHAAWRSQGGKHARGRNVRATGERCVRQGKRANPRPHRPAAITQTATAPAPCPPAPPCHASPGSTNASRCMPAWKAPMRWAVSGCFSRGAAHSVELERTCGGMDGKAAGEA